VHSADCDLLDPDRAGAHCTCDPVVGPTPHTVVRTGPDDLAPLVVLVTPLADDVPANHRVCQWLKVGLRSWKLRCITLRDPTSDELARVGGET
jgi:hypothetical protein